MRLHPMNMGNEAQPAGGFPDLMEIDMFGIFTQGRDGMNWIGTAGTLEGARLAGEDYEDRRDVDFVIVLKLEALLDFANYERRNMRNKYPRPVMADDGYPAVIQPAVCGWGVSWNPDSGLYYIENLAGVVQAKVKDWRNVCQWCNKHSD